MALIRIFLERPRMLILSLIFFYWLGILALIIFQDKKRRVSRKMGTVNSGLLGTSPEQIETQVTEVLEIKLREIPEIRNLISNITQGASLYSC